VFLSIENGAKGKLLREKVKHGVATQEASYAPVSRELSSSKKKGRNFHLIGRKEKTISIDGRSKALQKERATISTHCS
jgi:hypothetical protein